MGQSGQSVATSTIDHARPGTGAPETSASSSAPGAPAFPSLCVCCAPGPASPGVAGFDACALACAAAPHHPALHLLLPLLLLLTLLAHPQQHQEAATLPLRWCWYGCHCYGGVCCRCCCCCCGCASCCSECCRCSCSSCCYCCLALLAPKTTIPQVDSGAATPHRATCP